LLTFVQYPPVKDTSEIGAKDLYTNTHIATESPVGDLETEIVGKIVVFMPVDLVGSVPRIFVDPPEVKEVIEDYLTIRAIQVVAKLDPPSPPQVFQHGFLHFSLICIIVFEDGRLDICREIPKRER
jgi:hypothetical protein